MKVRWISRAAFGSPRAQVRVPQVACLWRRFGSVSLGFVLLFGPQTAYLASGANRVLAWGQNNSGQCTPLPDNLTNVVAIAGGVSHSVALNADGTVVGWGLNLFGQATPPTGLSGVVAVSAGSMHTLALKSDGTVVQWGTLSALPPTNLAKVKAIAAGYNHSVALTADGTVVSWGSQTDIPNNLGVIVAISAGNEFSVALRADGSVVAWGNSAFGKTDIPFGLSNVVAIAAGGDHCLALQNNGVVVGWGANYNGQTSIPGDLTNAVAIAAGGAHSLALRADGTMRAWGNNDYGQSVVNPALTGFAGIAAGGYHSLALMGNGAPTILLQPPSQTVPVGSEPSFFVLVAGNTPLTYQWLRHGTNMPGKTAATLTLSNVSESDQDTYAVVVHNAMGNARSADATLTVVPMPPLITTQPMDQTADCGDGSAAFLVVAQGKPLTYQWYFEGSEILGATKDAYSLNNVTTVNAGSYFAIVSNPYGTTTSAVANLYVAAAPPSVTSPLYVPSKQGLVLNYQITALHNPLWFAAKQLPPGLFLNPTNGIISGTNYLNGVFNATVTASNACATDSAVVTFDISDSIPVITSALIAAGTEGVPFTYQITASNTGDTNWPTVYSAAALPPGLIVEPGTGRIFGTPVIAGVYDSTICASNAFGAGRAVLHTTIGNTTITGLSMANILTNYSSPYLLDFQFSLRDNNDPTLGSAIVVDPRLISIKCFEDDVQISTNETEAFIVRGITKVIKAYLTLDYTLSIAALSNGDTNGDGVSDAVESMVAGAKNFVNQMPADALLGVYEFHREDYAPSNVVSLATDKVRLNNAISGIWTNYVKNWPAGSRCWDAASAAVKDLGANNNDEQHYVILVSDGVDESSTSTVTNVIVLATNNNVHVYAIGFGDQLPIGEANLQMLATNTGGHYYAATNSEDLASQFAQVTKDLAGQYIIRWATLKRDKAFLPSFQVTYQGYTATSPPPVVWTNMDDPQIDTNSDPPTTNYPVITNYVVGPYNPKNYTGDVTVGALRLLPNADVRPTGVTLRTTYTPRNVSQIRLRYRANWPCNVTLSSTNDGEILYGWTLVQTNGVDGSTWALLSSRNPSNLGTSIRFASFGSLLDFRFQDAISTNTAFSILQVDNTIYTNTGKQSWAFNSTNLSGYIKVYPVLPYGTPVPWLIMYNLKDPGNNYTNLEVADSDGDGALNWQEYRANTVPTNAASSFVIRGFYRDYNGLNLVTFQSGSNRMFRIDVSNDLLNWTTATDNIIGTGQDLSVYDPIYWVDGTNLFYRVFVY